MESSRSTCNVPLRATSTRLAPCMQRQRRNGNLLSGVSCSLARTAAPSRCHCDHSLESLRRIKLHGSSCAVWSSLSGEGSSESNSIIVTPARCPVKPSQWRCKQTRVTNRIPVYLSHTWNAAIRAGPRIAFAAAQGTKKSRS